MAPYVLFRTPSCFRHKVSSMLNMCSFHTSVNHRVHIHPVVTSSAVNLQCQGYSTANWAKVVSEAEKVVGYPTSFLSLKYLLSDEISNIAVHLRKLVGSNHPILKTAKKLLSDSHSSSNPRGLIILLLSKIGNKSSNMSSNERNETLKKQRALAEIIGMIYTVQLIHTSLIDVGPNAKLTSVLPADVDFGNKISVLSGDYLLANASMGLSKLRNTKVVELIAEAIQDFTKSKFIRNQLDLQENVQIGLERWERWSYLSCGSLLEKGCRSALELANLKPELAAYGSEIGKNIGLAWQARMELDNIQNSGDVKIDILSLPVLLHLKDDSVLLNQLISSKGRNPDLITEVHQKVSQGYGKHKTSELGIQYCANASRLLSNFPPSEAQFALKKLIQTFHDVQR